MAYLLWGFGLPWRAGPRVLPLYLAGLAVQCLHLLEEYLTGFGRDFPALFGLAWNEREFLAFNLVWLAVFLLAALGLVEEVRMAYLVVIFFAVVGEIANAGLHLAMGAVRGAYFPGLWTAPLHAAVGVLLVRSLLGGGGGGRAETGAVGWP